MLIIHNKVNFTNKLARLLDSKIRDEDQCDTPTTARSTSLALRAVVSVSVLFTIIIVTHYYFLLRVGLHCVGADNE